MKARFLLIVLTSLPFQLFFAGDSIGLEQELARLKTDTAMVVHSQAVDEYPLWSADGTFLYFNISDHWKKIDLALLHLDDAVWRGDQTIAVNNKPESAIAASNDEIKAAKKVSKLMPRKVVTKSGLTIELRQVEMSTHLIFQPKDKTATTRWETGGENCHSLVLSPDQRYVAFICELNGVIIIKID